MNGAADFDLVVVGGGLAGSSLAAVMARAGHRVLLLEREKRFRDRVRGEAMMPWGVAEAARLGLLPVFAQAGALPTPRWRTWIGGQPAPPDEHGAAAGGPGFLTFSHPALQEALIGHAAESGAEVLRGVALQQVRCGTPAQATFAAADGVARSASARLLVGAEGRAGPVAQALGAVTLRAPRSVLTVGFELTGGFDTGEAVNFFLDPREGWSAIVARTGAERCRSYLIHHQSLLPEQLSGEAARPRALSLLAQTGVPAEWLAGASPGTPLASFDGAWRRVDRLRAPGVVLIGDAAGTSDPAWGNGLSRSLRDVRLLSEALMRSSDWDAATAAAAAEIQAQRDRLQPIEQLQAEFFLTPGPEAAQRRQRVFPLWAEDPTRQLDSLRLGPDVPFDEDRRRRYLGED